MVSRIATTVFLSLYWITVVDAQMIYSSAPYPNIGSSYGESNSIHWSLQGPNWFANSGGNGPLLPAFGSLLPSDGLSGGFGFGGGGVRGNLGFNFAQSSNRTISSQTPSLTTMNGYSGSFSSGVVRPFVTGFTPVVGGYPTFEDQTVQQEQQQLSALRQSQARLENRTLDRYLRRAEQAESSGNLRMARANYRLAIGIAAEPLRSYLQNRMQNLVVTRE